AQVTRAYLAQAGLGILGQLLGGSSHPRSAQVMSALGGFGLNTLFLKFSRGVEQQADLAGAQIMSRAGYDPNELASFFQILRRQSGPDPGKFAPFFSGHPAPVHREA